VQHWDLLGSVELVGVRVVNKESWGPGISKMIVLASRFGIE